MHALTILTTTTKQPLDAPTTQDHPTIATVLIIATTTTFVSSLHSTTNHTSHTIQNLAQCFISVRIIRTIVPRHQNQTLAITHSLTLHFT